MKNYEFNSNKLLLLIPIFMLILAIVFDIVLIYYSNYKLDNIIEETVTEVATYDVKDYKANLNKEFKKNYIEPVTFDLDLNETNLKIFVVYYEESFIGKLIGRNAYKIESQYDIKINDQKVEFNKIENE